MQTVENAKETAIAKMRMCGTSENLNLIDNLITAVRAECRAVNPCERKCVDFCNAYETGKSEERAKVLAEFRMLADGYWTSQQNMSAASDICDLIKSLETPNQKP